MITVRPGDRHGKFTAVEWHKKPHQWLWRCDCGNFAVAAQGPTECKPPVPPPPPSLRMAWYNVRKDTKWPNYEKFALDMGDRPPGARLRRPDPTKPFGPKNCVWHIPDRSAPPTAKGRERSALALAAQAAGTTYALAAARLRLGWSMDRALSTDATARDAWKRHGWGTYKEFLKAVGPRPPESVLVRDPSKPWGPGNAMWASNLL